MGARRTPDTAGEGLQYTPWRVRAQFRLKEPPPVVLPLDVPPAVLPPEALPPVGLPAPPEEPAVPPVELPAEPLLVPPEEPPGALPLLPPVEPPAEPPLTLPLDAPPALPPVAAPLLPEGVPCCPSSWATFWEQGLMTIRNHSSPAGRRVVVPSSCRAKKAYLRIPDWPFRMSPAKSSSLAERRKTWSLISSRGINPWLSKRPSSVSKR